MFASIALVFEILATLICLHGIFGKEFSLSKRVIVTSLILLVILDIINHYDLNRFYTFITYIVLYMYCILEFKSNVSKTLINLIIYLILFACMQFIVMLLIGIVIANDAEIRNVVGNGVVFILCCICIKRFKLSKLSSSIYSRGIFLIPVLFFIVFVVFFMVLQMKIFSRIQIAFFVFSVPAIGIILYFIVKWSQEKRQAEKLEKEVILVSESSQKYNDFLLAIRMQQHEFKNHIAAIFSAHYTYKSYEELVKVQAEYCGKVLKENRYNSLLNLGSSTLVAFLYQKFVDAEDDGIEVMYEIKASIDECSVDVYYLVELLGILLDNAVEALKDKEEKKIYVRISGDNETYLFEVRNTSRIVTYDEMKSWFVLGESSKGAKRGLGLYHLKMRCDELKYTIKCQNIEVMDLNWVQFMLSVGRAEK